ncbi:unnamed protein product, partial [Symbiodinium sp. CCMP2592]
IEQTNPSQYENTGFDKGHLAPSLATSFDRKELGWQELENALHEYAVDLPREFWLGLRIEVSGLVWNGLRQDSNTLLHRCLHV